MHFESEGHIAKLTTWSLTRRSSQFHTMNKNEHPWVQEPPSFCPSKRHNLTHLGFSGHRVDDYPAAGTALKASHSISQSFPAGLAPRVQSNLLRSTSCTGLLPFPTSFPSRYLPASLLPIYVPVLPSNTSQRNQLSLTSLSHRLLWLWGVKTLIMPGK